MIRNILFFFVLTFILFCLFTYLFIDPNFYYLKNLYSGFTHDNRLITVIVYFLFISILFCLYVKMLNFKNFTNFTNFKNSKFLLLIPIAGILAYPAALSFDLFNYIATAKVAFGYLENPYIVMPIELVGEPILIFTRATNKVALYGPLWTLLSSIPYYLSLGNYLLTIILFKLLVLSFYLGTIRFLWKMTKNIYSVLFFAASPLVLIETFISGHNDVVMMFFALGSLYFLKDKKITLSIIFLVFSIMVKYATIFLIPVYIYYLYKRRRKEGINWDFVYKSSFFLMLIIFFLSPLREEIYPWYAIWPLTFLSLVAGKQKMISTIFIFFAYCLMLRYIPFMLLGTYFGPTPYINLAIIFLCPGFYVLYLFLTNKYKFNK